MRPPSPAAGSFFLFPPLLPLFFFTAKIRGRVGQPVVHENFPPFPPFPPPPPCTATAWGRERRPTPTGPRPSFSPPPFPPPPPPAVPWVETNYGDCCTPLRLSWCSTSNPLLFFFLPFFPPFLFRTSGQARTPELGRGLSLLFFPLPVDREILRGTRPRSPLFFFFPRPFFPLWRPMIRREGCKCSGHR